MNATASTGYYCPDLIPVGPRWALYVDTGSMVWVSEEARYLWALRAASRLRKRAYQVIVQRREYVQPGESGAWTLTTWAPISTATA